MEMKREYYLDLAKSVAVYLVVVHHVRDYAGDPAVYAGMAWIENLSSLFNVAVFFAIGGYLSRGFMLRIDFRKLGFRTVACLWPVVSILCVGQLQSLVLNGRIAVPECGWIRVGFSVGWFFFCLVTCETLTFAAFFLTRKRKSLLPLGLGAVFVLLWIAPVGLFHALEMIPFYWFGLFALPRLLAFRWGGALGVGLLALHLMANVCLGDFRDCGLSYHVTTMHLQDFNVRGFLLLLSRYAIGLTGAAGGILTVRLLASRLPVLNRLAFFGTQSLGVFFVHMLVLTAYYARVGWTGGGLAGRLTLALAVFVLSHFLVVATRQTRWLTAILWNPLSLLPDRRSRT